MIDRPSLAELLDAVRMHLESRVVPAIHDDAKLYFQTLVAINVLRIAEREIALSWAHLGAEWASLNALEGEDQTLPTDPLEASAALAERNRLLAEGIRAGRYDERQEALFEHLIAVTEAQLQIANPKFLELLHAEDQAD